MIMRLRFLIVLLSVVLLGGVVWYFNTANQCPVPLAYRLGALDEHFKLTPAEAQSYFIQAEAIWEAETGRELFVYDDSAAFTINFIFDERQEKSDAEASQRASLDEQAEENERIASTVESLRKEYETLATSYEARLADYEQRLDDYNQDVRTYNDQGGAPQAVYEQLEETRANLNTEAANLSTTAARLNELGNSINELSDRGNELVAAYNKQVEQYNDRFGFPDEFTQGDYQGDEINIYEFSDESELVVVLAHEFGHALGIDHVEGNESIMYYLLEEQRGSAALSHTDKAAFLSACGTGTEIDHRLRRMIREVLTIFNR